MENIDIWTVIPALVGLVIGAALATIVNRKSANAPVPEAAPAPAPTPEEKSYGDDTSWLLKKQELSGSQRQILEFIESSPETSIQAVQERFGKVPDRELFYRLEQIHLLGFIDKERKKDKIVYSLTDLYASAVQVPADDKTVMISRE